MRDSAAGAGVGETAQQRVEKPDDCPISTDICHDPIKMPDANIYEREEVVRLITTGRSKFSGRDVFESPMSRKQYPVSVDLVRQWDIDRDYRDQRDQWLAQEGYKSIEEYVRLSIFKENFAESDKLGVYEVSLTGEQEEELDVLCSCSYASTKGPWYNYLFKPLASPFVFIGGCVASPFVGIGVQFRNLEGFMARSLVFCGGCAGLFGPLLLAMFLTRDLEQPVSFSIKGSQFQRLYSLTESAPQFENADRVRGGGSARYIVGRESEAVTLFQEGLPFKKGNRLFCFSDRELAKEFCQKLDNGQKSETEKTPMLPDAYPQYGTV